MLNLLPALLLAGLLGGTFALSWVTHPWLRRHYDYSYGRWVTAIVPTATGAMAFVLSPTHRIANVVALAGGALVALVDLNCHRIPTPIVWPVTAMVVMTLVGDAIAFQQGGDLLRGLTSGVAYLLLLYLLYRLGGIGMGDVRLAALLGTAAGAQAGLTTMVAVMAGFMAGGLFALVGLLSGRFGLQTRLAYGPAMVIGLAIALGVTS